MGHTVKISDHVSWVGVKNPNLRSFDIIMPLEHGTTYNSYLIHAKKKTIVDTVKAEFSEEFLSNIRSTCNLEDITYVVINHTEPDHSGSLEALLKEAKNATVVGTKPCIDYLQQMIGFEFNNLVATPDIKLNLGESSLSFIEAPNLHWPDTMLTYYEKDKVLFSCDVFGAHYCHDDLFSCSSSDYKACFKTYFDTILKPFSNYLLEAIEKLNDYDFASICPGHGPVLTGIGLEAIDVSKKLGNKYLSELMAEEILIAYVSSYGYTAELANAIYQGALSVYPRKVHLVDLEKIPLGELEAIWIRSKGLLLGSPTFNKNTILPIYQFLSLINPYRDEGKQAAVFGSYGWSGEALEILESSLEKLQLELPLSSFGSRFRPFEGTLEEAYEFGVEFANELL